MRLAPALAESAVYLDPVYLPKSTFDPGTFEEIPAKLACPLPYSRDMDEWGVMKHAYNQRWGGRTKITSLRPARAAQLNTFLSQSEGLTMWLSST